MRLDALSKSFRTSTEKLSPLSDNDLIFNPISRARNNSISSIFSNGVFLCIANFSKAKGKNEITDKCLSTFEVESLYSNGIFPRDK